jgi:outer membrane protein OmpA-like peptidoglycan-associated protein
LEVKPVLSVRRIVLSLPVLIVAGLMGAYLMFAWVGFEPLTRWLAPKFVADQSAHRLTIGHARFDPFRLTVQLTDVKLSEPNDRPLLAFDELWVDFELESVLKRTYVFEKVQLTGPAVQVDIDPDGQLNWKRFVEAFAGAPKAEAAVDEELPRVLIRHAVLRKGRVILEDRRAGSSFRTAAEPLDLELHELSTLPDNKGDHVVSLRTSFGAVVRWKGELGLNPLTARGDVAIDELQLQSIWPYLRRPLQIAPPEGLVKLTFAYRVGREEGRLAAQVEQLAVQVQQLGVRGVDDREATLSFDRVALTGGRFDLVARTGSLDAIQIDGGKIALERSAEGRLNVQQWTLPAGDTSPVPAEAAASDQRWRFSVGRVGIEGVACRVVDKTFAAPLSAEVGRVNATLRADIETWAGGRTVNANDLAAEVQHVRLTSAAQKSPLLELDQIVLQGGQIDVVRQTATLAKLALHGARTGVTREAGGEVSLLSALRTARSAPAATANAPSDAAATWRYRIDRVEADGVQVALRDESVQPALSMTLQHIKAEARGFSDDGKAAMPVRLQLQVREGGRFEAQGQVVRAQPSVDLRVKLDDLALQPAQPLVAQAAHLKLAGGRVSSAGRVRLQGSKVRYDGAFEIKDLLLNESDTDERFLAWKSLGTKRLAVTTERAEIDELHIVGLGAKVLIDKDRTTNVAKIAKARPQGEAQAPKTDGAVSRPAATAPGFGVKIARLRVSEGDVDFADLSLALPFGARIHGLQGQMVGLSNEPGRLAQVEFQGQVDEYGLSRAAGQINLFDPTAFTDIRVIFQNVEMTRLTPYSATFAGRKIASGKLSLDLEYKIKDRQLQGENQVVMDELTLGEHVDSPSASNLPLDLALAVLQDENGKITLGLPVSGNLDDPQFSYGGMIGKALTTVLTKVVTAPFRALGGLFGGEDEQTAKVVFDAGDDHLLPPEREKVHKVAQAVAKRPRLSLAVHAAFDPAADGEALKAASLRRAVAAQMGRSLQPGADAGPISTSDPQARAAIEALYAKQFGAPALQSIQATFAQANPAPPPADAGGQLVSRLGSLFKSTPPPLSAEESAQLKGADLHARLLERLHGAQTISDEQLRALGASRAQAISRELVADGVASDRIQLEAPSASGSTATISLGAMPKAEPPSGATATAAAPSRRRGDVALAQ